MTRLCLVRHAHADWQADEERPLSEIGRHDAVVLAGLPALSDTAAIYSSPARRAIETITPLAKRLALEPTVVLDLRERELPVQDRQTFEAVVQATWMEPDKAPVGGESNRAAQKRGVTIVRQILARHAGQRVVLATHGNILALILSGFEPRVGYDFWRELSFPDVYELTFNEGTLSAWDRVWRGAAQQPDAPDERAVGSKPPARR